MYQRILVPIDGSITSAKGLEEAIRLAGPTRARIRLLHVVDPRDFATGFETAETYVTDVIPAMKAQGQRTLEAARARVASEGIDVETLLLEAAVGRVADVVVEQAAQWKADVIVIGTHGRRGVRRLALGSDAEQIARTAPVPVLLVRTPDDAASV